MVPGHEQATARLTPDGGLELRVGAHSHGQGLETTLAQVAHEILGIDTAKIKRVHGRHRVTPYSTGTWGSRCMVMAGGAVATRLQRARRVAPSRSAPPAAGSMPTTVQLRDGQVCRPTGSSRPRRYRAHLVPAAAGSAGRRRSAAASR